MLSNKPAEHFVTLFDSNFLPMGLCLHRSLMEHAQPFHLWIVCMDESVEQRLRLLDLPQVSLIPLCEAETRELLEVKKDRTRGEYCWTITPFTPKLVFDRDGSVERVTYLDADLFFFDSPQILLGEFEKSSKHVLITEHSYDPKYDQSATSGRFCVQFMTFRRTPESESVMCWWQERCLEWCFARFEDGKFGDQKYLDDWPERFSDAVHVLKQVEKTLAPWNSRKFVVENEQTSRPVFYHFHALRIIAPHWVLLFTGYSVSKYGKHLYKSYMAALRDVVAMMKLREIEIPILPTYRENLVWLRYFKRILFGTMAFARI